jgi:pyridoxine kinase
VNNEEQKDFEEAKTMATGKSKQILLVNDMAGYGKVALSAMIPVLSHMKHNIYNLPTALVSNTLDYGKFDILETTDYMRNTIKIWDELGFSFDAVATGFIVSEEQAKLTASFCKCQKEKGAVIFVDPIMGDEGMLYNGVTEKTISHMKELIKVSDYIVPNYTEAAYLAEEEYKKEGISESESDRLIEKLIEIGAKSVVITSAKVDGRDSVIVYDYAEKKKSIIPFTSVPVRFPGTGDIFSAIFTGEIVGGNSITDSTKKAMETVKELIEKNKDNVDKYKGIPLESYLEVLDR